MYTDLGKQYTSEDFRKKLEQHGIIPSYSHKSYPHDNVDITSFHATLKKEKMYRTRYANFEVAHIALFCYIENWHNRKRIHISIGSLSPDAFEQNCRVVNMSERNLYPTFLFGKIRIFFAPHPK